MKAAHYTKYGGPEVFSVIEKVRPQPGPNEVLVKVYRTTVNRTDTGMTSAVYFVSRLFTGLWRPKKNTPGTDFSGVIEMVGKNVSSFKEGDEVFGFDDNILSSQAEYMIINEDGNLVKKPPTVTHDQAAASIEGSHYALNVFNNAGVKPGDQVLIYGATGAIGTSAVQIATNLGLQTDAVGNTKNLNLIHELGAEQVYDYEKEDYTATGKKYDLVFDAVGKSSYKICKKLLKSDGLYISTELGKRGINIWLALTSRHVKFPFPKDIKDSLNFTKKLLEKGQLKPVIDRTYKLDEIQDAYEYVSSGRKTGNVILKIL